MIIHTMPQGSPEWFSVKCGKISASNLSDVLAKGQGKVRKAYMMRLIAERLSGIPKETCQNGAMQWGIDNEAQARLSYESLTLNAVQQVGFIEVNEFMGCSPDGLIDDKGGLEIKCPNSDTHLQYILYNRMPSEYICQVQGTLWMTGREWWDFESFDPRIPIRPIWTIRVYRDEAKIKEISTEVEIFKSELLELEQKIKGA